MLSGVAKIGMCHIAGQLFFFSQSQFRFGTVFHLVKNSVQEPEYCSEHALYLSSPCIGPLLGSTRRTESSFSPMAWPVWPCSSLCTPPHASNPRAQSPQSPFTSLHHHPLRAGRHSASLIVPIFYSCATCIVLILIPPQFTHLAYGQTHIFYY